jgi:chorismate-pyruvate lyase
MMSDEFRVSAGVHHSSFITPHLIFPLVVIDPVLWPADSVATLITAADLPELYRGLLAHTYHMTVTVEAHYGCPVDVRVLESGRAGDEYHRRIVLTLHGTDRIVQYGLVRINLALLDPEVRAAVEEQKTPLGRILIEHNVLRRVEPTTFLRVQPGPTLCRQMALTRPVSLYGRTGVIFCNDQPAIAVLEVLSPV